MNAITAKNLEKKYILRQERNLLVQDIAKFLVRSKKNNPDFFALKDISFNVEKGETFGIIGENGSGKSTLLKIISGVTKQSSGEMEINGNVSALLELGAGFHPYLTGRENIYLNGSIIGMKKRQINKIFDDIVSFAEIEDFIDVAVKNYSSGMFVRLGFAIAIHLDPDILIIDEVLSVGDEAFQRKCFEKINEFKKMGKTIVFVTHDMNAVSSLCDRVMLLKKGEMLKIGKVGSVVQFYMSSVGEKRGVFILTKGKLTLMFNNGKINFFFDGKAITRSYGGYSAIYGQSIWHESTKATWKIIESSEDYLKCSGKFRALPLNQIWEIKILDENSIEFKLSLEILEMCSIDEIHFSHLLSDDYTQWFSEVETGVFPDITSLDREWIHLNRQNYPSAFCGVIESDSELPGIAVDFSSMEKNYIATMLNSDCTLKSRVIQCLKIFTKTDKIFESGIYEDFFTCNINLLDQKEILTEYLEKVISTDKLQFGKYDSKFTSGSLKISNKINEITCDNGIFISILSEGCWHDSMQSIYECKKILENELDIKGKFRRLPIVYTWEIRSDGEKLFFDLNFEIQHKIQLENLTLNFSFDSEYDVYTSGERESEHDAISDSQISDILITSEKNSVLPKINLKFNSKENELFLSLPETDPDSTKRIIRLNKAISNGTIILESGILPFGKIAIEFA